MRSSSCRPRSCDREATNRVNRSSVVQDNEIRPWRRARSVSREPVLKVTTPKLQNKKQQTKPVENDNNEIKEISKLLEKDIDYSEKNKAASKIQATFRNHQQQTASEEENKHSENIPTLQQDNVSIEPKTSLPDPITKDPTSDNNLEEISADNKEDYDEISSRHDTKSHEDVKKEIESIKQKLENSISQTNAEENKREKYVTPTWLLPASVVPYPFNFISAVRHKLEIATRHGNHELDFRIQSPVLEKSTKDISIQASPSRKVNASIQCEMEQTESQKVVNAHVDSPARSFRSSRSHKCRRKLDVSVPVLKSPESLAESKHSSMLPSERNTSNISGPKHNSLSLNNKVEDSDSDTTKNIPEIPEEELRPLHKSPSKSIVSEYLKNITFSRASASDISDNVSKKSTSQAEMPEQLKNITFDRGQASSKESVVQSDIMKNITFHRANTNDSEDLKALTKPDYQMDISKVLPRKNAENKSSNSRYPTDIEEYSKTSKSSVNRDRDKSSRYPSDIESILSHYSKRSSWRQSTALNDTNYSDDFNSSVATHSSLPNLKSTMKTSDSESHKTTSHETSSEIQTEHISSVGEDIPSNGKDKISVKQSINAQRNTSSSDLNLKFPVKQQSDMEASSLSTKYAASELKHSDNTNVHSVSQITHSNTSKVQINDPATNNSNSVLQSANISKTTNTKPKHSSDMLAGSQSLVQTSNVIQTLTNENTTVQSVSLKTDSHSVHHASSLDNQETQASSSSKDASSITSRSVLQTSNIPNLTKPGINLKIAKEKFSKDTKNNPNQIHLKFQAEIHLLNSFNKSLQQIVAIEKSLLDSQDKENHNADDKSFKMMNHSVQTLPEPKLANQSKFSSVNYKRGCDVTDSMSLIGSMSALEPSVCSQDLGQSQALDKSSFTATVNSVSKEEEQSKLAPSNVYFGMSIGMFDQMIKDEDIRLEHFKTVLKLRDKALFDRTKGELAWLEIQKKQLRENGQLSDVTMIKKKQRGLIIKLEQERHEMQRLKQAHKQAAKERKNALREQKNIIKHQLSSTDHIPSKIKRLSRSERRQSGPLKVYRVESRTELVSETTMSRKSSLTEETVNVTTSSLVTQISERVQSDSADALSVNGMALQATKKSAETDKVREALLMKEAALEKRRKEAEELLEWHKRLKEEETRVAELERQAKSLALDAPDKPRILTGAQLNQIWKGITGQHERKFDEQKKYRMSKKSLDRFYTNARKVFREISDDQSIVSKDNDDDNGGGGDVSGHSYTTEFEQSVLVSQLNASNLSGADRIQNVLDTSRLERTQKNESSRTIVSTVSDKSLITESAPLITSSHISEDSGQISSDEQKSQMSTNSKKSIILSNISIQEMIASLKNAISACQIKTDSYSTISQKNTSLDIQDTNVSSSESQIASDIKQSVQSSQDALVSDSLPKSNVQNSKVSLEKTSSDVQENVLHSTRELIENIEEHIGEIEEPIRESDRSHITTETKGNSEKTSGTNVSSQIQDESELHSVTNAENRTSSELLIQSDSRIVTDSDKKSEIVESNILDVSKTTSNIISAPESASEQYLESLISKEQKDNVSPSLGSSKIEDTSVVLSEKYSVNVSPNTDINSSSNLHESIPSSDPKCNTKSSTLNENIQKTKQDSEVVSEIKDAHTTIDIVISELNSTYSENEASKQISDYIDSKTVESASQFSSELKPDHRISSASVKDEGEAENLESNTEKSEVTETNNKSTQHISGSQNEELQENKSESHIQTENSRSSTKSEEVSFEIKQSDDDIIIEITRTHDTSSDVEEIVNKTTDDTTKYTDNYVAIVSGKSDTLLNQPLSAQSNISSQLSQSENLANISETEISKHESESLIPSLTQSDIHWSIFKDHSEKHYSEFESDSSSADKTNVQSDDGSKHSEKEEDTLSKSIVNSEKDEYTEKEKSEIQSDDGSKHSEKEEDTLSKSIVNSEKDEDTEKEKSEIVEEDMNKHIETESDLSDLREDASKKDKSTAAEDDLRLCLKDLSESSTTEEHSEKQTPEDDKNEESSVTGVSHIDVRKRVSEILADATPPRGDKSPRVQDLYITTYDIMSPSPDGTPEIGSPTNEFSPSEKSLESKDATGTLQPYTSEAEELLRKQLEIEQEIKRLERQQQDLPYMFMREIPNKPPPPYKPPEFPAVTSVIPARADQVTKYVDQAASVLYSASVNGTLADQPLVKLNVADQMNSKRFVFDLCRELALDLYKPTCDLNVPSWKRPKNTFNALVCKKPVNKDDLTRIMKKKVLQLFNFEPVLRKDSLIVRWSRKKRDHVDEILVLESQSEEADWTNYDVDEQTIKDNLTSDILNSLISETAQVMNDIMNKKKRLF
ncbi:hypothetical protein CBL_03523 [Carabus blaptoides fortunei]